MNETLKFRHEWKHEISYFDMLSIRQSMMAAAHTDLHAVDGKYEIRSLYFDNLYDKALREKSGLYHHSGGGFQNYFGSEVG